MAISQTAVEVAKMGKNLLRSKEDLFASMIEGDDDAAARIQELWLREHRRHREIVGYMRDVSLQNLVGDESVRLQRLLAAVNCLDTIAAIVAVDMQQELEDDFSISQETQKALRPLHEIVMVALDRSVRSIKTEDPEAAVELSRLKQAVKATREELGAHLLVRLQADDAQRVHAFRQESAIAEDYQRIFILCRRIAKQFAKPNGD
jgi:Na+/phosphate symporter